MQIEGAVLIREEARGAVYLTQAMPELPILYIKPGCPWCDDVVDYLARKKIAVKVVDIFGNDTMTIVDVSLGGRR